MAKKKLEFLVKGVCALRAHAGSILVFAALACACKSWGQAVEQPNVQSLDRQQAEQERLKKMLQGVPKAYLDKVMVPGELPSLDDDGTIAADSLADGYRTYFSESRFNTARGSADGTSLKSTSELGQSVGVRGESLNYGDYEFTADLRTSKGPGLALSSFRATESTGSRFTLRNTAFPITTQTFADTAVGDISTDVTDALARNYRLSLGTRPVRGVSNRFYADGLDLRAGFGQRGELTGGPFAGFERTQGSLAWAGSSKRLNPNTVVGLQFTHAADISRPGNTGLAGSETINAMAAALGWAGTFEGTRYRFRLVGLQSEVSDTAFTEHGTARGLFAEGSVVAAGARYEFGAYQAEPNLRFGDNRVTSDSRGAYGRVDAGSRRTSWGLGLQLEDQNPEGGLGRLSSRSASVQGNIQHQLNGRQAIGGDLNLDWRMPLRAVAGIDGGFSNTRAFGASAYFQNQAQRGSGAWRLRAAVRRNEQLVANAAPSTGEELELENDWSSSRFSAQGLQLVTTLGLARERVSGVTQISPTAGVTYRAELGNDWNVNANLRYTARNSNLASSQGLAGMVEARKRLPAGWQLGGSLNLNQAVVEVAQQPGLISAPPVSRSNNKYASIWVRWDGAAGATARGLGFSNRGSAGAGSVEGFVYFDANRDGEQQSAEAGVPAVEVLLDGRFRTTTDRNGRFSFPLVTTGPHQLSLRLETVPLPWGANQDEGWRVEVPLRGEASVRIPVVKVGD